jgi:uncharacterized membrane protein YbhN (UPF0104 family)
VAVTLLWLLLRQIPLTDVLAATASARASFVLGALGCAAALQAVGAVRLRLLTDEQRMHVSWWQVLQVNLTTTFYAMFLPGGVVSNSAVRYLRLTGAERAADTEGARRKRAEAVAAIAFDRLAATVTLCVVGLPLWLLDRAAADPSAASGAAGLLMVAALVALLGLSAMLFHRAAIGRVRRVLHRVGLGRLARRLRRLFVTLSRYHDMPAARWGQVLLVSFATHACGIGMFWCLARGVDIEISLVTAGWLRTAVTLVTMIPVTVAGLGLREGALIALLHPYGVAGEQAMAMALLILGVRVLVAVGVGGGIEATRHLRPHRRPAARSSDDRETGQPASRRWTAPTRPR